MISSRTLRFGMVGAGAIAQAYAEAFQRSNNVRLAAVADIRKEAASDVAQALDCEGFEDFETMFDRVALDAVVVCTPPNTHPEICISSLQRHIPTLCEKPLAIDSASAQRMVQCAQDNDTLFTMASKFRYVDDVIRSKSIVTSGILGDIILFENVFTGHVDMSSRWNAEPEISGGGVLIDNGTHSVDIMRYFLGPLHDLQVVQGKRVQYLPVEDTVKMFVRTESGTIGSIDLSWSLHKPQPTYISIYGTNGTVHVGWKESKYCCRTNEDWIVFGKGYDKREAFTNQINNFAATIRGDESLLIKPSDALASVAVIEAAYEALNADSWIPVPPVDYVFTANKPEPSQTSTE